MTATCPECQSNVMLWPTATTGRCTPAGHYLKGSTAMKTITVNGPDFRITFEIAADRERAVVMRSYLDGSHRPSTVSTGRSYVAQDLRIARNRPDCTIVRRVSA